MKNLENVLLTMKEHKISQLLISDPAVIFYLTGVSIQPGERMLVLALRQDGNHRFFINDLFHQTRDLGAPITYYNDTQDGVALVARALPPEQAARAPASLPVCCRFRRFGPPAGFPGVPPEAVGRPAGPRRSPLNSKPCTVPLLPASHDAGRTISSLFTSHGLYGRLARKQHSVKAFVCGDPAYRCRPLGNIHKDPVFPAVLRPHSHIALAIGAKEG